MRLVRVRLKQGHEFSKITVAVDRHIITVGNDWVTIPDERFLRNGMEVEGQSQTILQPTQSLQSEPIRPISEPESNIVSITRNRQRR